MNQRPLGKTGLHIGEIGLGCWQFGGDFGAMDETTARSILATALDGGTDFLDTADVYGGGCSEEYIGRFLKTRAETPFVATKFGRAGGVFPNGYTREAMRAAVGRSLGRLGVKTLDLLQLHCVPTEVLRAGQVFGWLRELQDEGLIRHFGASVESVEEGLICLREDGLVSLQIIFNLFRQKPAEELLPQAAACGVGIIVRLPLASGLLAGKYRKDHAFAETDHRNYNRDGKFFNVGETFAGLPFAKGVDLADALREFLPPGMNPAQMAQRWILDHPQVSVLIPGASSPDQARANAAISGLPPLSPELHKLLRGFYEKNIHAHIRGPY